MAGRLGGRARIGLLFEPLLEHGLEAFGRQSFGDPKLAQLLALRAMYERGPLSGEV